MRLPAPHDGTSLVLRTDFSDDARWQELRTTLDGHSEYDWATYVDDPVYQDVAIDVLIEANAAVTESGRLTFLFVADSVTMGGEESLLMAVDLLDEPGRTFRVPPRWYPDIAVNMAIANMDFADYAACTDERGVFRGFGGQ